MAFFHQRPDWYLPESKATPEKVYLNRRALLRAMGLGGLALAGGPLLSGCSNSTETSGEHASQDASTTKDSFIQDSFIQDSSIQDSSIQDSSDRSGSSNLPTDPKRNYDTDVPGLDLYPVKRNDKYKVPERGITPEDPVQTFNNYYEFSLSKGGVWKATGSYDTTPWTLEIVGLVDKPLRLDLDDLIRKNSLEERVYRFRCVEAWAMTVPWTGFSLADLLKQAQPKSSAKYVRFLSVSRPSQMPNIDVLKHYTWPYHEALRLDEALNELSFVVTGVFGHPLTKQMGAPLRIILPWKYGYKGPKAVTRIELTDKQPPTFWNTAEPSEYGFYSNVNPKKPHPRWSQAKERLLPDGKEVVTQLYNGYAAQVSSLYKGDEF